MTLPPIQTFHPGGALSLAQRLSISSFITRGHPLHLYTYGTIENPPEGAEVRDARLILPNEKASKNHFRWTLLYHRGGWWADTDVVCLAPLRFVQNLVLGYEHNNGVSTSLMRIPKGYKLAKKMYLRCQYPWRYPIDTLRRLKASLHALFTLNPAPLYRHNEEMLANGHLFTLMVMPRWESLDLLSTIYFHPQPYERCEELFTIPEKRPWDAKRTKAVCLYTEKRPELPEQACAGSVWANLLEQFLPNAAPALAKNS